MSSGAFNSSLIPDSYKIALTATEVAIEAFIRVKYDSSGTISKAAAAEPAIGTTLEYIPASGIGAVKLFDKMMRFTAGNVVACGAFLTGIANGKVDDAAGVAAYNGYQAYEAATANGDVINAFLVDSPLVLTAGASMGALNSYVSGSYALNTDDHMLKLFNKVEAMAAALVTAGIIKQGA